MAKSDIQTQSEPAPRQPLIITARITVPLMEYGNLTLEATQEIDLPPNCNAHDRSTATIAGLELLKSDLALVILPIAESEVKRAAPNLLKDPNPDYWMRKNSPMYKWLRLAEPELEIPAMNEIIVQKALADQSNSALE